MLTRKFKQVLCRQKDMQIKMSASKITQKSQKKPKIQWLIFAFSFVGILLIVSGIWSSIDNTNIVAVTTKNFLAKLRIYTEKVPTVEIQSTNYDQPGSWHIDKSAKWTGYGTAQVTFDLKTMISRGERKKDIVLVLDTSGSMVESTNDNYSRIGLLKKNAVELVEYLLADSENRVALITFDSTSDILSEFTNDKDTIVSLINELETKAATNYNLPLLHVNEVMNGYEPQENRDAITLFLTDGHPNEDTPNQIGTYEMLKDKYPYMVIQGIQYEMGYTLVKEIQQISDNQWIADGKNLHNVLFDAALAPYHYDKFQVVDYIENDYFTIESEENINTTIGTAKIETEDGLQKIVWDLGGNTFISGGEATMTLDLKLKDEYIENEGFYPTNRKETIFFKLQEQNEKTETSELTPVLKNAYEVIYDSNLPTGCSEKTLPSEKHYVYQNVTKRSDELSCDGYLFKGWEISNNGVIRVNDDVFVMPEEDVVIRAIWSRQSLVKTMSGTVHQKTTLYDVLKNETLRGGLAKEYTGEHQDSMNGPGDWAIYHYYAKNNAEGTEIQNKNNVLFGNYCWQMVRTTDTGGVKMIYNGVPDADGHCGVKGPDVIYQQRTSGIFSSNYYYATDYSYDVTARTFALEGTKILSGWNDTTWKSLVGKYTCLSSSETDTCTDLYYIEEPSSSSSADISIITGARSSSKTNQIGSINFNQKNDSPAYIGYMYNKAYTLQSKSFIETKTILQSNLSLSTEYFYGDDIEIDTSATPNVYRLVNPKKITSSSEYANLTGKYTFRNSTEEYTYTQVYYIAGVSGSKMYYFTIYGGNLLDTLDTQITFGDGIEKVKDEIGNVVEYKLTNPISVKKSEWFQNYANYKNKYTCNNDSNTCVSPYYTTYTNGYKFHFAKAIDDNYKYANSFIYNPDTQEYTLTGEEQTFFDWSTHYNKINNTHYTCWNTTGVCKTLSYIYRTNYNSFHYASASYIDLTENISGDKALESMLHTDEVNSKNSLAKSAIDWWYRENMTEYTKYIEDTIFCNNRSIINSETNGWNPNGGDTTKSLQFKEYKATNDLSCLHIADRFSISNEKAKLNYPVGLMTSPEMVLLNNAYARGNQTWYYWLMSPYEINSVRYVGQNGSIDSYIVNYVSEGVRPAISLIPGIEYTSGDGSTDNPYVVDLS